MILLLIAFIFGTAMGQNPNNRFQTEEDLKKFLLVTFEHIDENHNGYLEIHELRGIYIFEDANGDGKLTLAEYEQAVPVPHSIAEQAFNYYDVTGKGYLPIDDIFDWYSLMDANDDGLISQQEYMTYELDAINRIYGPIGTGSK